MQYLVKGPLHFTSADLTGMVMARAKSGEASDNPFLQMIPVRSGNPSGMCKPECVVIVQDTAPELCSSINNATIL